MSYRVDTMSWAPAWMGLVLSPWLVAPWLAGAWTGQPDGDVAWGATAGLGLLSATVATYLVLAGPDATALLPGLLALALTAGPGYGAAGALLHRAGRGRLVAAVVLGAALVAEGLLLQFGERNALERAIFAIESGVGAVLATWMGGSRAGLLALLAGVVLLGVELAVLATIGPRWP
jgi:hypothetical protein